MLISIVIPFYNEAASVPTLASRLLPVLNELSKDNTVELVLVDDGSRDGTTRGVEQELRLPRNVELAIETHPRNLGLGAALRTGFQRARGDVVITTDFDGTYAFSEIPELLGHLAPEVDIVTASPYHPAGGVDGVPGYRLVLSRGSSLLYRIIVDWNIFTYTSLFRAYRRSVIQEVPFEADGFLAGTELLVKAKLRGFRVAEYPAVLRARAEGASKAKLAKTTIAHLRFQGRVVLHRLGVRKFDSAPGKQSGEARQV
ncbi:MAG: glycosyltransferase family 2 protein [Anaerolineales bacterium]